MPDARRCIRMTPCVQSRRPHSAAVRVGATPGLWQPTGGPDLPHPCVVPIACPSERTTTVNNGATSPSHLPPDNESAQVSCPMAAQAPSLPKLGFPRESGSCCQTCAVRSAPWLRDRRRTGAGA
jgi:hypothetical protein